MPEAILCSKTIAHGKNRYRFYPTSSKWEVLMWGWWYNSGSYPEWRWMPIPEGKVPDEVKRVI